MKTPMPLKKLGMFGVFALASMVAMSCSKNNFTNYNVLGDPRILTIVPDSPEVNPGTTVHFTPVISDVNGQGRALNYTIQACIDPGVGVGAQPHCLSPDPGSIQAGAVTPPAGNSQTYTGAVPPFSITVPDATTMFTGRSQADQYNGIAYLVFYTLSVSQGPSIESFVRVIVSSSGKIPKNQNPVISSVNLNDSPINGTFGIPSSSIGLNVASPGGSSEIYQIMKADGTFQLAKETLISTWFISDGSVDNQRTIGNSKTTWSPPSTAPSGRGSVIIVVTRDGRDGSAYQKIEMQ